MNIQVNGVQITLTQDQLNHIHQELNKPVKPTAEQRFLQLCEGLTIKIDKEKYPNSIFFFKGNDFFFEYNSKSGSLWCSRNRVWSFLEKEYSLNYNEIESLIKDMLEKHFNLRGVTPSVLGSVYCIRLEKHFNLRGVTPKNQPIG